MAWTIPSARTIAARLAGTLEAAILAVRDVSPVALSRAVRSARGVLAQIIRAVSLEMREVHDHQAWWSRQLFADTAEDEFMLRHAGMWGVTQRPAKPAVGAVKFTGTAGTDIPGQTELADSLGTVFVTAETVEIGEDGTVIVAAEAREAGSGGNLELGIRLVTVEPLTGVDKVEVSSAIVGGVDDQSADDMRAALLERIRRPPQGGNGNDYQVWIRNAFSVAAVAVAFDWIGRGSVGVIVIMEDEDGTPRVPTDAELAAMLAYLGPPGSSTGVRPGTAHVVTVPGIIRPLDITVALRPDTVLTRAAVTEAYARFVATIGDEDDEGNQSPIGALIEPSRIGEAISAANGEYAHDLISPAAPFRLERREYPVAGTVSFEVP